MPRSTQSAPGASAPPAKQRNEYTVDELARVTDSTVRNLRPYQDHGPLARGCTLANILDLIKATDEGQELRSIPGLKNATGSRWSHERP